MKRTGLPFMVTVIAAMTTATGNWFNDFRNPRLPSGKPNMPHHSGRTPKFRRHAPDGKWSMKCHRGRV